MPVNADTFVAPVRSAPDRSMGCLNVPPPKSTFLRIAPLSIKVPFPPVYAPKNELPDKSAFVKIELGIWQQVPAALPNCVLGLEQPAQFMPKPIALAQFAVLVKDPLEFAA
jgi:hypothetical protein